jgi:polysaccharide deacetylase family protein (PEP-CTERM system associated)
VSASTQAPGRAPDTTGECGAANPGAERRRDALPAAGAMTIDVEDYYQVEAFSSTIDRATWNDFPSRVEGNANRLLDILAEARVRATFFTLGCLAQRFPAIPRRIVADGHELASHGTDHVRVDRCSPAVFRADVRTAKQILEDVCGVGVKGYRAPTFSISGDTAWAHAILAEVGYLYSSSVYPIRHDLYGSPDAPRSAFAPCGGLIEIPMTTVRLVGRDIPASGGGYFRLFPYVMSRWLLARAGQTGTPPIFYMHPWEIDPRQPRQRHAPWRSRLRHYLNLGRTEPRLRRLLRDFAWARLDELFLSEGTGGYPSIAAWTDRCRPSR